jgi:tetratricopeptide (TPR) repeat protein
MKLKTFPAKISIGLLALALAIFFAASAAAQNPGNQPLTWGTQLASNTSNPRIKAGNVDENPTNASPGSADYWFDKGALCATYGNDRAAVKYFQKAIALDPDRSGAYFEQGISYGQLNEFSKAIPLLNKAITMEPQNGLYLYGRGRVYLLNGKEDLAMQDFIKAAQLGDEDAQAYLEHIDQLKKTASHQPREKESQR